MVSDPCALVCSCGPSSSQRIWKGSGLMFQSLVNWQLPQSSQQTTLLTSAVFLTAWGADTHAPAQLCPRPYVPLQILAGSYSETSAMPKLSFLPFFEPRSVILVWTSFIFYKCLIIHIYISLSFPFYPPKYT